MRVAALFILFVAGAAQALPEDAVWSPDHSSYVKAFYLSSPEEREKLVIYNSDGKEIATAHVWLTEPDGTMRIAIRGCETIGWVDASRIFCKGSPDPHTLVTRIYDAKTGKELEESAPAN